MNRPLVLVTGATDGIGRETALQLARRGAEVIVHGRDARKASEVRRSLEGQHPEPVIADFASLESVRAMAAELERRGVHPSVLLNNAGLYARRKQTSAEGFELTMAVNHLAPVLLTHLMLAAKGSGLERIVNVSSMAHSSGRVDPGDVGLARAPFDPYANYAASKLANVLFTVALAPRVAGRGIHVNALHPGVIATKLLNEGFGMMGGGSLESGAQTSVLLALEPVGGEVTGRYFSNLREARMHPSAQDTGLVERFYEASVRAVGVGPLPRP
jgi:NAD(P)-dependent dehydrogenase (short-subunit alcohol dehydrogenase family)